MKTAPETRMEEGSRQIAPRLLIALRAIKRAGSSLASKLPKTAFISDVNCDNNHLGNVSSCELCD
jgi:hypothetical protein